MKNINKLVAFQVSLSFPVIEAEEVNPEDFIDLSLLLNILNSRKPLHTTTTSLLYISFFPVTVQPKLEVP